MLRFLTILTALVALCAPHASAQVMGQTVTASRIDAPYAVRLTEYVSEQMAAKLMDELPAGWTVQLDRQGGLVCLVTPPFCDESAARMALPSYKERFPLAQVVAAELRAQPVARPWSLSLRQLGFERDVVLQSGNPSLSFSLPLPGGLDLTGATLEIKLRLVKTDIPFKLTVMVENEPVFSATVPADGMSHSVAIPVTPGMRRPESDSLAVEVLGAFEQGGVRCVDAWSSNLFMVVENATALKARVEGPARNIAAFFDSANTAYRLCPTVPGKASSEAALRMASLLGATQRGGLVRTLDVGPLDPAKRSIVLTQPAPGVSGVSLCADTLQVTPEGAGMLSPKLLPLLAVRSIRPVAKTNASEPATAGKTVISLDKLGISSPRIVHGYGNLPVAFSFFLSDLGGMNEETQLTLRYNHSPVTGGEGGFLLVYLNDALVGSKELGRTREPQTYTVNLPAEYLGPVNTVRAVFATPRCNPQANDVEFEGTIMPDSSIESQVPMAVKNLTIGMAGAFMRSKGEIVLSEGGENLEAMANLVKSLSLFGGHVLDFDMAAPGGPMARAEAVGKEHGPAWRLLALSPAELAPYKPLLDLSRGFKVVNPLSGQVLVDGESGDALVVLQAFRDEGNRPCIALVATKPGTTLAPEMLSWEKLRGLSGNLAVLDGDRWVSVKVGEVLEVRYSDATTLQALWLRYRLFIVIGAGAILFGLLASWWRISAGGKTREKD